MENSPTPSLENLAVTKLIDFGEKLKTLGLTPCERFFNIETLKSPTASAGFPIVEDGLNGIRTSYSRGKMEIWFTNTYQDPKNETRIKVQEIWDSLK